MAIGSSIEWTQATWNPVTGCSRISEGCMHCYAETMAKRLQAMGQPNYKDGFKVTLQPHMLDIPLKWKHPRTIFVNSMSDLFHELVPIAYIKHVFDVMQQADWHCFQVLTKRSKRLLEISEDVTWPSNVWMGVSVENRENIYRIHDLLQTKAKIKFLSLEPLLGPLGILPLKGIDWVIVGGESGPGCRSMDPVWVEGIFQQCKQQGIPFFFKQWGGFPKKKAGRLFKGAEWNEFPNVH